MAAHGWWCNARTFPIVCKYCGDQVFFFSCDCGSKQIFNSLGAPWPEHHCRKREEGWLKLEYGREIRTIDQFYNRIEADYVQAVDNAQQRAERSTSQSHRIQRQEPYHNSQTTECGVIRELIPNANIFRRTGVVEGSLGAAALGRFASGKYAQITIHTAALAEDESQFYSFSFFVDKHVVKRRKLIKGTFVECSLRGIVISPKHPIWICLKLTELY